MFIQVTKNSLDALINLKHAVSITAQPYESGYQLVADFPTNWKPFDPLRDTTGRVVILEGPCTEECANDKLRTLSTERPKRDMVAYTPDNQPVKLNHIVLVIKERHGERVPVIAYYTYGIDRLPPRQVYLCYADIDNEETANDVFGMAAISCGAIPLED